MSLYLTASELVEATDYKVRKCQIRELTLQGIPFRITSIGSIKVLRSDIEKQDTRQQREREPDYGALST